MSNTQWVDTKTAAAHLGITAQWLRTLRKDMKPGQHYLIVGRKTSARPTYRWNIEECSKLLAIPLEKRN